jgi:hypothetical protein
MSIVTRYVVMLILVNLMLIMMKIVTTYATSPNVETIQPLLEHMGNAVITIQTAPTTHFALLTTYAQFVRVHVLINAEEINARWTQKMMQIVTSYAQMMTAVNMMQRMMRTEMRCAGIKTLANTMNWTTRTVI